MLKKLFAIVLVLFGIETWGVFGAWRTDGVMYNCTLDAGPLCFWWEESGVTKLLGKDAAEKMEEGFKSAQERWKKGFLDKTQKGKNGLDELLEKAKEALD